ALDDVPAHADDPQRHRQPPGQLAAIITRGRRGCKHGTAISLACPRLALRTAATTRPSPPVEVERHDMIAFQPRLIPDMPPGWRQPPQAKEMPLPAVREELPRGPGILERDHGH